MQNPSTTQKAIQSIKSSIVVSISLAAIVTLFNITNFSLDETIKNFLITSISLSLINILLKLIFKAIMFVVKKVFKNGGNQIQIARPEPVLKIDEEVNLKVKSYIPGLKKTLRDSVEIEVGEVGKTEI